MVVHNYNVTTLRIRGRNIEVQGYLPPRRESENSLSSMAPCQKKWGGETLNKYLILYASKRKAQMTGAIIIICQS